MTQPSEAGPTDYDLGTKFLRFERDGSIAWCTIDRPAARNALTPAMYFGLKRAVQITNAAPDLAALIITGVEDSFTSGGDLSDGGETDPSWPPVRDEDLLPFLAIRNSAAPVIAAINGICHAGGLLIAMLADIAVASDRADFRVPELLRGIPDAAIASALPAHVGVAVARDLMFTARRFSAEEAVRLGVISRVVPHEDLRHAARQAVREVLRTAPNARVHVKRMLNESYSRIDFQTMYWLQKTNPEMDEGKRAFVERRPPNWVPAD